MLKSSKVIFFVLSWLFGIQIVVAQPIDIRVHDPVMIKQDNTFYLFCTGRGITVYSSPDMKNWKREDPVFSRAPEWTRKIVPGFRNHEWAPDISSHNGKYYLYYSVSAFGKNTSAIGFATNTTLDPQDPACKCEDQGYVGRSIPGRDLWNAIDPNPIVDDAGSPWLMFGSFWHGIKQVKLSKNLKEIAEPQEWHTLASRARDWKTPDENPGGAAIEAPFIFQKGVYYYLFASYDYCCRGANSTYKVKVGRSKKVTGPYIDKDGNELRNGGGTLVVNGNQHWPGVGHEAVYTFDGTDYLIFHGYNAEKR